MSVASKIGEKIAGARFNFQMYTIGWFQGTLATQNSLENQNFSRWREI